MSKTVRVSERTYERIRTHKRDGETTAETLDRLVRGRPLTEFVGTLSDGKSTHTRETLATADKAGSRESAATVEHALGTENESDP